MIYHLQVYEVAFTLTYVGGAVYGTGESAVYAARHNVQMIEHRPAFVPWWPQR